MSGELFVFINRKQTMMKVLYFSRGGYCLWSKRLELGRFHRVDGNSDKINLTWTQLQCLIDGINWQKHVKSRRLNSI
ncbi:IS66 family insertion sequence element accessory protein TnpB, partial [Shewanella sairae]